MENNFRDNFFFIEYDNVYELHCKFDLLTRVHLVFFFLLSVTFYPICFLFFCKIILISFVGQPR
jgi:uncharacterized membrane protein